MTRLSDIRLKYQTQFPSNISHKYAGIHIVKRTDAIIDVLINEITKKHNMT